ncbi:hypothetical protein O7626_15250 [Micromonospora sp. WMMD1102]|uniref:hypothetical protein n=1 Tax=Micromonospora sp. WMMD1102 TaxID=3016105 RepID=UPI00241500A4|nr:hypothetical protein [Micromonospora sp. WMMD1102]MDG4787270.1 hypothetical protein [Micromonospora sp. WMMD1102]
MSFTSRGSTPKPGGAVAVIVVSVLAAVWAAAMLSPIGGLINAYMFVYMTFFAGPATLVSLSLTVMIGLVATDRIVLLIRHRVLLQSAHRSLGIIAVFCLVLHVLTKISAGHISPGKALLPFVSGASVYVGLGTVAGAMMVMVLWTGLVRARFAGVGKPWLWRTLHSISYAAWPIALVHGLQAGRAAATWVTLSYLLCMAIVLALLGIRLSVTLNRKRAEQGVSGSLSPGTRPGKPGRSGKPGAAGRTNSMAPAKRRTADEIRASRANSPARDAGRSRRRRWEDDTLGGGSRRGGRGNRWDDSDTLGGRRGETRSPRASRDDRDGYGGRMDDTQGGGRRRKESLTDLRGGSEAAIDAWARAGELDSTYAPRGRSDRFAVPEVPPPGTMSGGADPDDMPRDAELPWDSPRRWGADGDEDRWDRRRGDADDSTYGRPRAWDDTSGGADRDEPGTGRRSRRDRDSTDGSGRRSWREPADEPTSTGGTTRAGRRRAADEEPTERSGRHSRARGGGADEAEESIAEWGRAARYEPNLVPGADDDDDDDGGKPALIDLATRRSRRSDEPSGRSSRRRDDSDDPSDDGAYWTSLKGEAR